MTNVFISWSGDQSKLIGEEIRNWIPSVLQFAKPYFTPNDIEKGSKWGSEISKKLADSNVGIICVTKDNINKPWILFEAGALSKDIDHSRVCSILFGMENTDMTGPLTTLQTTNFEKSDFKKLMLMLNESGGNAALSKDTFDRVFEMWWPQLHDKISLILSTESTAKEANLRSDRELLEEVLMLTRISSKSIRRSPGAINIPNLLLRDFLSTVEKTMELNQNFLSVELNIQIGELLKILRYLVRYSTEEEEEMLEVVANLRKAQEEFIPF